MDRTRVSLKPILDRGDLIVAPGVYDLISAKLADAMGFDALYMTGYGVVASAYGLPDAGLASYTQMLDRVATIAAHTTTPLIADADTGYGGLLNVRETVRGYEAAGATGIQIEDQEFPKKCGHTPDKRVISTADMVRKIKVAADARRHDDTLIIARTDARGGMGLDEAIRRAEAYGAAGADILFVESPESDAEMETICRRLDKPCLANMADGGRTPILTNARLREVGYRMAIFPSAGFLAASAALRSVYGTLRDEGSSRGATVPLDPLIEMHRLMGFEDVWQFEKRYAETE